MTMTTLAASPIQHNPIWPWSVPGVGMIALFVTAGLLIGVTIWTYFRVPNLSLRRALAIITIRGLAILMVFACLMGTSCITDREYKLKSVVLVGIDTTASMSSVQDEKLNGLSVSRWDRALALLRENQKTINKLEEEYNLKFVFYGFGDRVSPFDLSKPGAADGKRTDHYQFVKFLYDKHKPRDDSGQLRVRAVFLLGDGADNRIGRGSIQQIMKAWKRDVQAPFVVIPLGDPTTPEDERDVILRSLTPPTDVAVKGTLPVNAVVDALGMRGKSVRVRIFFDDKEVTPDKMLVNGEVKRSPVIVLERNEKNRLSFECIAPATPGEIKVTMKLEDPNTDKPLPIDVPKKLPDELSAANNQMSTYVTVSKEGLSVLVVERQERFPEPQILLPVLEREKRIRAYRLWIRGAAEIPENQKDLFDFERRAYDVIILGDVSATRLREINKQGGPDVLQMIRDKVSKEGAGLLMMGGKYTFGNPDEKGGANWKGTPVGEMLPLDLNRAQGNVRILPKDLRATRESKGRLVPEEKGLAYVLNVGGTRAESRELWKKVPILDGHSILGEPPDDGRGIVFARTLGGEPLLIAQDYGKGRVMAFGGDTTYRWRRRDLESGLTYEEGRQVHANFWRQVVFWLARQEELEDDLRILPTKRRLPVGEILDFALELRGKEGQLVNNADYKVKMIDPKGKSTEVRLRRQQERMVANYKPELPGEYRIEAEATGVDPVSKEKVSGSSFLRFLSYRDDAETTQRSANHRFLKQLAQLGGGKLIPVLDEDRQQVVDAQGNPMERLPYANEMGRLLEEYCSKPPPRDREIELTPDWRTSETPSRFLIGFFLIFVQLLALEWFLRRRWGLT